MIPGVQKPVEKQKRHRELFFVVHYKRKTTRWQNKKERTTLGAVHINHGSLHGMQVIILDGSNSFDCRYVASIGSENRHQTRIHRKMSVNDGASLVCEKPNGRA
jgi:hypothetical protein